MSLGEEAPRDLTFLCRCHHALYHLWKDYMVTDWDVIDAVHATTPLTPETAKYINLAMDAKYQEFGDHNPVPSILERVSRELMINAPLYVGVAQHTHIWITIVGSASYRAAEFAIKQMGAAINPFLEQHPYKEIGTNLASATCTAYTSIHRPNSFMYAINLDDVKSHKWDIDNPVFNDKAIDILTGHIKHDMHSQGCLFVTDQQIEQAICDCVNRYHIYRQHFH